METLKKDGSSKGINRKRKKGDRKPPKQKEETTNSEIIETDTNIFEFEFFEPNDLECSPVKNAEKDANGNEAEDVVDRMFDAASSGKTNDLSKLIFSSYSKDDDQIITDLQNTKEQRKLNFPLKRKSASEFTRLKAPKRARKKTVDFKNVKNTLSQGNPEDDTHDPSLEDTKAMTGFPLSVPEKSVDQGLSLQAPVDSARQVPDGSDGPLSPKLPVLRIPPIQPNQPILVPVSTPVTFLPTGLSQSTRPVALSSGFVQSTTPLAPITLIPRAPYSSQVTFLAGPQFIPRSTAVNIERKLPPNFYQYINSKEPKVSLPTSSNGVECNTDNTVGSSAASFDAPQQPSDGEQSKQNTIIDFTNLTRALAQTIGNRLDVKDESDVKLVLFCDNDPVQSFSISKTHQTQLSSMGEGTRNFVLNKIADEDLVINGPAYSIKEVNKTNSDNVAGMSGKLDPPVQENAYNDSSSYVKILPKPKTQQANEKSQGGLTEENIQGGKTNAVDDIVGNPLNTVGKEDQALNFDFHKEISVTYELSNVPKRKKRSNVVMKNTTLAIHKTGNFANTGRHGKVTSDDSLEKTANASNNKETSEDKQDDLENMNETFEDKKLQDLELVCDVSRRKSTDVGKEKKKTHIALVFEPNQFDLEQRNRIGLNAELAEPSVKVERNQEGNNTMSGDFDLDSFECNSKESKFKSPTSSTSKSGPCSLLDQCKSKVSILNGGKIGQLSASDDSSLASESTGTFIEKKDIPESPDINSETAEDVDSKLVINEYMEKADNSDEPEKSVGQESKTGGTTELPFECDICFKLFRYHRFLTKHKYSVHKIHYKDLRNHREQEALPARALSKLQSKKQSLVLFNELILDTTEKLEEVDTTEPIDYSTSDNRETLENKYSIISKIRSREYVSPERKEKCRASSKVGDLQSLARKEKEGRESVIEPVFVCEHCGKFYRARKSLKDHFDREHSTGFGQEPLYIFISTNTFDCSICFKSFPDPYQLVAHSKEHANDDNLKCVLCGKMYSSVYVLRRHIDSVHQYIRPRPFKCDKCSYAAANRWHLKEHKRKHTGEQPFKCPGCDKSFAHQGTMNRHCKSRHGILAGDPKRLFYTEDSPDAHLSKISHVTPSPPTQKAPGESLLQVDSSLPGGERKYLSLVPVGPVISLDDLKRGGFSHEHVPVSIKQEPEDPDTSSGEPTSRSLEETAARLFEDMASRSLMNISGRPLIDTKSNSPIKRGCKSQKKTTSREQEEAGSQPHDMTENYTLGKYETFVDGNSVENKDEIETVLPLQGELNESSSIQANFHSQIHVKLEEPDSPSSITNQEPASPSSDMSGEPASPGFSESGEPASISTGGLESVTVNPHNTRSKIKPVHIIVKEEPIDVGYV